LRLAVIVYAMSRDGSRARLSSGHCGWRKWNAAIVRRFRKIGGAAGVRKAQTPTFQIPRKVEKSGFNSQIEKFILSGNQKHD
jgi:hypothetical protein